MAFFVKLYDNELNSQYLGLIDENDADHFHALGIIGDGGLFTQTDTNGIPTINNEYTLIDKTFFFKSGVKADNGDYLLHGSINIDKSHHHSIVVRINKSGGVVWSNEYYQDDTRENIRLIKSTGDTYFMSSWVVAVDRTNSVELIKINGLGSILKSVVVATKSEAGQGHDLIPYANGLILYGGGQAVPEFNGFVMELDSNLSVNWARVLKADSLQQVRDLVQLDEKTFVLTGESMDNESTFIFSFDINIFSHAAKSYDLVSGSEKCYRQIVKTSNAYYVIHRIDDVHESLVTKFDSHLSLEWVKRITLENRIFWSDILAVKDSPDELLLAGAYVTDAPFSFDSILTYTDKDLNSCETESLTVPTDTRTTFTSEIWEVVSKTVGIKTFKLTVTKREIVPEIDGICPRSEIDFGSNPLFQSPYVYLQAAGSDEADDSVRGFHLRWDLLRTLGETHLPKGNYSEPSGDYPTVIGFNRPDDYVRIYKTPFLNQYKVEVDFHIVPNSITEIGAKREWKYTGYVPVASEPSNITDVIVRFTNSGNYDILRVTIDPAIDPFEFMKNYNGIVEIQTIGKLMFMVDFDLATGAASLKYETISLQDSSDLSTRQITCRKTVAVDTAEPIFCDNIEFVRFEYDTLSVPSKITLIAYEDYMLGVNKEGAWSLLDKFALDDGNADGNANVFKRLEDSATYTIHGVWRKYNEPDIGSVGEFRVNILNYQERWVMVEGLKSAVETYLDKSKTDLKAVVIHDNEDLIENDSQMDISYLDMLNFVSLDYHAARMLGLGHIDYDANATADERFVYLMEYVTDAALEDGGVAETVKHYYMVPPLTIQDYKLPPVPVQKNVSYGVYGDNKSGNPTLLTDPNGYNPYGPARFVNIHREKFNFELPYDTFFASTNEYCLCEEARTVLFGLEYANDTIVAANSFVRPEISHDTNWEDLGTLPEVSGIPNSGNDLVYMHEETTSGIHHYALYSINWFSRVSEISNKKETDVTTFPKVNTLLPPGNLAVQLIQKENPRIFTTELEQSNLLTITDPDKTYVRITFDWNQIQNQAYNTATGVELFWRESEPLIIQGKIKTGPGAIVVDNVARTVTVQTEDYFNASVNQTIVPEILLADVGRFDGTRMTINGDQFVIDSILTTGVNPTIRLKQIRQTASQDVANDNIFCTTETWINPEEGQRFLITENLDNPASWDIQLAAVISVEQFSTHTESVTYDDGTTTIFNIGGLTGSGVIADVIDPTPNIVTDHVPPGGPSAVPTGVYTITFDTELLPPHPNGDPNAEVDYINGTVRLKDVNGDIKTLNVWKIEVSGGSTTVLTAYDPTFGLVRDVNNDFVLTAGQFTAMPGYIPIVLGAVPFINYHPSYRVYIEKGTGASPFNETNILPDAGEGTKNTFIAARSIDTVEACESFMTVPAVLLAREIIEPVAPGIPDGPLFATRPNFYGKATYTFDVEVVNPFALIFYRSNEQMILDQLYTPDKVAEILTDLSELVSPDLDFFQDRWHDLVNMDYDMSTFTFKEYVPGGYRFPMPNNDLYKIPHANNALNETPFDTSFTFNDSYSYTDPDTLLTVTKSMAYYVKQAIEGAFLPLTEIPPIYKQLQEDVFQTSSAKPTLRDPATGQRLLPGDTGYNPWPMALRFEKNGSGDILQAPDTGYGGLSNTKFVRFTDYTIDGAAKNFYFYFGVEMSATLAVSPSSPVSGPIQLVNSEPTVAPQIKKITTQLLKTIDRTPTAVLFEMNEYVETDNIKKIQIYRTNIPENALSVRTMDLVKTVNYGSELIDDFKDQLFPLYGDPLFYRIVALREIVNEQGVIEYVPSVASNVALTNVVDNQHPSAPKLNATHDAPSGSPIEIDNVEINFNQTAYNATYFLYYENGDGNWVKIKELTKAEHLNAATMSIPLSATDLASSLLKKQDANLNPIYHHFRVDLENSSGLPNLSSIELTL